ncbi:hypothetical protein BDW62DRAFT_65412 [Aspergillus aurantiobrunneus]
MFSKSALAAAAILGFSLVDAHMVMVNPVPYSFDPTDNKPLDASGSDFPCKVSDYSVTQENHLTKGQPHNLEFKGGATHGGGSCQISITSDRAPTKDTQWSVIKSIEGGCMDPNEGSSNAGTSASMKSGFSPSFTIPDSFEDGQYTLAWTWINRIGNREFYMNCAPITVSGGSSSKRSDIVEKRAEDFPAMFIANINGCKTEEMMSPRFPNPGADVESFNEAHLIPDASNVCTGGSSPTWGDAGMTGGGGSAPEPTSAGTPTTSSGATASVSLGGAVGIPNVTGAPAQTSTSVVPTSSSTLVAAPAAPTSSSTSGSTSTPSTSEGALSGSCTDEGAWNCVGGSSFQRCASGTWTDVQTLSSGTECTPGQNQNFAVKAVEVKSRMLKEKRRRSHGHIHA